MKILNWKVVMFGAVILMLFGFCISLWGIGHNNVTSTALGLITMAVVCVSWWFWVMFIIRSTIKASEKTLEGIVDIRKDIETVKLLVKEYNSISKT